MTLVSYICYTMQGHSFVQIATVYIYTSIQQAYATHSKSEVLSSNLLQKEDNPLHHLCSLLLQAEDGSRGANEHFGLAVGHVVFEPTTLQ